MPKLGHRYILVLLLGSTSSFACNQCFSEWGLIISPSHRQNRGAETKGPPLLQLLVIRRRVVQETWEIGKYSHRQLKCGSTLLNLGF